MVHDLRTLQSLGLALTVSGLVAVNTACSSDSGTADSGVTDTGTHPDANETFPDATADAGPRDFGPRPDAQPLDASEFCTVADSVSVAGTQVHVGASSMQSTAGATHADLSCRKPAMGTFNDPMFIRGCLNVLGAAPTPQEIASLEFSVFPAKDMDGMPVDPSYNHATGMDNSDKRVPVSVSFDTSVPAAVCASQVQVDIGYDAVLPNSLVTEQEYIIRARTATTAGMSNWATEYYFNVIGRNDAITKLGGVLNCTSQACYARYNFTVLRASTLATFAGAATTQVPGSANLTDGRGSGYGLIELDDCSTVALGYAVAGFSPVPLNDGYLSTDGMLDLAATESTAAGMYLALGFPGQDMSATTGISAKAGVGVNGSGACTEEFAGGSITIYPDSVSVFRASRENVLHNR